jgi:zinc protease
MKLLSCLTIFFIFSIEVFSQSYVLTDTLPTDHSIITGTLPNGLTYYIRDNGKSIRNIQIRMVVNAGSILEDDDQLGLAHFMEHMNFNGLEHFPKNELVSYLESNGLKFGADLNAMTGMDATSYILWLPAEENKKIDKAFLVVEDWDHNAMLDPEEISQERSVVLEESRLEKNANARMRAKYYPDLISHTKYAYRLPIGSDSSIENFRPESLKRFYTTWYRPDLTAIIVGGNIDVEFIQKEIARHFGNYINPPNEVAKPAPIILNPRPRDEFMVVTDKEMTSTNFELLGAIEKDPSLKTWSDYRKTIVEKLYTILLDERLKSLSEQNEHKVIGASAGYNSLIRGYRSFNVRMSVADNQPKIAIYALENILQSVNQFGFLAAELERAKSNYLKIIEQIYLNREKTGTETFAEDCSDHFTDGKPLISADDKYFFTKEQMGTITLDEINGVARGIGSQTGNFALLTAPDNGDITIPGNDALGTIISDAKKVTVTAYTEKSISNSLLATQPRSGGIDRQTKNSNFNTTNLLFKNGITVTLRPTKDNKDDIQMDAWRYGGSHNYGLSNRENAMYAARIVQSMGISRFSKPDLDKFLSGKTVSVQPYLNAYEEGIEGKCSADDLETFLQLIYAYFTEPAKNEQLFRSFISRQKGIFQNNGANPQNYFLDSSIRFQYENNAWANTIPSPAEFERINLDTAYNIYRKVFGNAHGMHFTFVGNFDIGKIKPLLETYLGSLPAAEKRNYFTDEGLRPRKGVAELRIKKGESKQSRINLVFTGESPMLPMETLKLDVLCEVIQRRIMEKLREEMGGIYTAGVNAVFNKRPYEHYSINIRFGCSPENADVLMQAVLNIINDIRENGVDRKYLKEVTLMVRQHHAGALMQNEYWLQLLSSAWINNQDPSWVLSFDNDADGISSSDMRKTAEKYFDMNNYLKLVLLPAN